MDEWLDIVWFKIVAAAQTAVGLMDVLVSPLNRLGPAIAILILSLVTAGLTKLFRRLYTTKRYQKLKKEYEHWMAIRKEAMAVEDRDKGKRLARNIDQAKLNKVYYDYFFEGLLNNMLTTILPILLMAAYINEAYNPDKLLSLFGRPYVFRMPAFGAEGSPIGALLWFVLSLILIHVLWALCRRLIKKPDNIPKKA